MLVRSLALATIALGLFACSKPDAPGPGNTEGPLTAASVERRPDATVSSRAAARPPSEPRSMVRLDYTLTITDPGKPPTTSEYTLNVEEHSTGEVRLGKNVPLQVVPPPGAPSGAASARPMAVARQDVGILLRSNFSMAGDTLTLRTDAEMSSVEDGTVHKISLKGDALVTPGKPAVVSTSEDPTSHRRYQLTVTATKLR